MSKQPEGNMTEPIEYAGKKIDTTYITIRRTGFEYQNKDLNKQNGDLT